MHDEREKRASVLDRIRAQGGLTPSVADRVSRETGVPEAEVYGVGSFFHLLNDPGVHVRVCTGLSCRLAGADAVLEAAREAGWPVSGCSCLAACDAPPAVLKERTTLPALTASDVAAAGADWTHLTSATWPDPVAFRGHVGPASDPETQALDLLGAQDFSASALDRARELGAEAVIGALKTSGLQGRGGAGFPAHIKWGAVLAEEADEKFVVLNADEGEPGTFKDREVMLRRPDLVLEGLAIAATLTGAREVFIYLRGAFEAPWRAVEDALERFGDRLGDVHFHLHAGHGAYICGEETALLEALEGRRGMPRLKPPYPTQKGLWGQPTLMHNVETIACVPAIVRRGGDWFRALGRTEPGSKLYCLSGHVARPGTYELPLGVSLDELVEAAGGYVGTLKAFSPGGASSGFLPARMRELPLDFGGLAKAGSMLGSAGVVVLNDTTDMAEATFDQLRFFEDESCGQCAPCRIGTRYLREHLAAHFEAGRPADAAKLTHAAEVAWQMNEGSICGLGQTAPLPLTSAMRYFPEDFGFPEAPEASKGSVT